MAVEVSYAKAMATKEGKNMQRFKTTILLASILGILIVATIGASIVSNKKNSNNEGSVLVGVNMDEVDKIEITNNGAVHELVKTGNQWVVASQNNVRANQAAVNDILNKTKEIKKDELVSSKPENQSNFEVDGQGVQVKLFRGTDNLADFIIGKAGSNFDSTYVRAANDDNVYLTKNYIRMFFDKSDFRDLTILSFDQEKAFEITINQNKKDPVILQKKEGEWKAEWYDEFELDEDKMQNLLQSLSNFSAKDIVLEKSLADAGLENSQMNVAIKFDDGSDETLNIGDKVDDEYFVKRSAADTIYTVAEFKVKELQKGKDDFAK